MDVFVKTTYANIYDKPTFSSSMLTQALLWEKLEVISSKGSWFKVKQWDDGYEGWLHSFYVLNEKSVEIGLSDSDMSVSAEEIMYNEDRRFIVKDPILKIKEDQMKDSQIIGYATLGSKIPFSYSVKDTGSCLYSSILPDGRMMYLTTNRLNTSNFEIAFSSISSNLLGCPYLWGGKTPFGFDCSGLVQIIFKCMGIEISRDTNTQIDDKEFIDVENNKYEIGDVIFFNIDSHSVDHVGLYYGDGMVIHCGGEVKIEPLNDKLDKIICVKRYKRKKTYIHRENPFGYETSL